MYQSKSIIIHNVIQNLQCAINSINYILFPINYSDLGV